VKCENLDIWKRSAALSADIYSQMHHCKDFGFKDQLTRSGLSIPSNIAEGLERQFDSDTLRFFGLCESIICGIADSDIYRYESRVYRKNYWCKLDKRV
jgi:hypothetical protein